MNKQCHIENKSLHLKLEAVLTELLLYLNERKRISIMTKLDKEIFSCLNPVHTYKVYQKFLPMLF